MMKTRFLFPLLLLFVLATDAPAQDPAPEGKDEKWTLQEYEKALTAISEPDSIKRARAVAALGRVGLAKGHEPLIRSGLRERMAHMARLTGENAVKLDRDASMKLLAELAEEHRSGSPITKRNLVIMLREVGTEEAGALIVSAFGDSAQKAVLLEVVRAIGTLKIQKGVSIVKQGLSTSDLDLKNAAAIAAGNLGATDLVPALFGALDTTDGEHCKFAAWALTRIDDVGIFPQIAARLGNASGVSGEAKAKVLEGSARVENAEKLIAILSSSKSREYREAAAIALGRLRVTTPEAQEVLFARMLRDTDREVRGASWHALSRVATEDIAPLVLKRQGQSDPEKAKYIFHLIGDLRLSEGTSSLLKVMINERKNVLLRNAAAINFWKAADRETVKALEKRLEKSSGVFLERGVEALGFRRNPEGFRFAVRMLQILRDGSKEEYLVEKALERMTGHFFGSNHGIWLKWYEKNPEFFTPKQAELERNKWREDFDKENEGFRQTEETERAVQLGLEYLARHQHTDGRFDPQYFFENCEKRGSCSKADGARVQMDPSGMTAICTLAFLGAGYTPDQGKYKDVVARALEYLMAREQANGNFKTNDLVGGYNRPIGAQALAEAYMLTGDERLAWHAQVALDFLATIQNKLGGWRYRVKIQTTDTSVVSWNLFALKTGEKAGLEIREIALTGCYHVMDLYSEPVKDHREDFIDIDPEYGYEVGRNTSYEYETGYQNPVWDTKYATVPLGIMCRIFLGWRRSHPFCIGSANKILADMMEEIPKNEDWSLYRSQREYPTYAWYYGTLAMHQMGGRYFRRWNEVIRKVIPGTQVRETCTRGSWPGWNHDGLFGRMYTTAMGVLALETYYRYLPVLQD